MTFDVSNILIIILSLVISITIHEMMHAFTAHWLGDPTAADEGRITLNPLPHIDPLMTIALPAVLIIAGLPPILAAKPVPFNPDRVKFDEFGSALVGLAGPVTNLVLAVVSAGILGILHPDYGTWIRDFLLVFLQINVGLFVFNMLPLPPLDGSRVLYAFAPEPVQKVMLQIEQMGIVSTLFMLFILIQLGILGPIISTLNDFILRLLV